MSAKKIKIRNWGIQSKIIILFFIALSTVVSTAYYVRENEKILRKTLYELSRPEKVLPTIHEIISTLPEAENRLRFFALTDEYNYFSEYENLIDSVERNVKILGDSLTRDTLIIKELDSINILLNQRKVLINEYLVTKENREKFDFNEKAITTLKKAKSDTTLTSTVTTKTVTQYDTLLTTTPEEEPLKKKKGLLGRIKNIFRKEDKTIIEKKSPDTVAKAQISIQTDTSFNTSRDSTRIKSIEKKLQEIKRQEINNYEELVSQELEMLRNSSLLINQITGILKRIEFSINNENQLKSAIAIEKASRSLKLIGLVSLVALFLIILLIILIIDSIRKINRYRRELMISNVKANELARVKEEFLTNMSHEIRTPLNAVIGFSDQLVKTNLTTEQGKYLDAVRKSSHHLLDIVNDILDITKLSSGKLTLEKVPFRLSDLVHDVISPFRMMANEKGLKLIDDCGIPEDFPLLKGDPLRIRQILYNLLSNAVKFTLQGRITIQCNTIIKNKQATISIIVEDTGIGIDKNNITRIFEDFHQADSSMARHFGGSGLGLAISRRLARLHGGDIDVESKRGKGSRFTLTVKTELYDETNTPVNKEVRSGIIAQLKGKRILIADDDQFNTLLAETIGEKLGLNISIASDGFEAEKMLLENEFDLIMTDLQMPGLTGEELVKFIRNNENPRLASAPVIAFTAHKISRFDERLTSIGFNEVLQKPFDQEEFIDRVANYTIIQKTEEPAPEYFETKKTGTNPMI